jgi:hypothetical protein
MPHSAIHTSLAVGGRASGRISPAVQRPVLETGRSLFTVHCTLSPGSRYFWHSLPNPNAINTHPAVRGWGGWGVHSTFVRDARRSGARSPTNSRCSFEARGTTFSRAANQAAKSSSLVPAKPPWDQPWSEGLPILHPTGYAEFSTTGYGHLSPNCATLLTSCPRSVNP